MDTDQKISIFGIVRNYQAFYLVVMAFIAFTAVTFDGNYSYYQLVRWVICLGAVYLAYRQNMEGRKYWVTAFVLVAILFNPIVPFYFTKDSWQVIDFITGVFMVFAYVKLFRNNWPIIKSKQFWVVFSCIIVLSGAGFYIYGYKNNNARKCNFYLSDIKENRYQEDKERTALNLGAFGGGYVPVAERWRVKYGIGVEPARHYTYWEVDGLLRNESKKAQYLHSIILKIYSKDESNVLLTEGWLDVGKAIEFNQSYPFQVRAEFNRDNPILSKYFDKNDEVRIDVYPYFSTCQ